MTVTQQDIDDLVALADRDPKFKEALKQLDELARIRKCELSDVIESALEWYYGKQ